MGMAIQGPLTYILRNIDRAMWRRAKMRAAKEGTSLRAVILAYLAQYAAK